MSLATDTIQVPEELRTFIRPENCNRCGLGCVSKTKDVHRACLSGEGPYAPNMTLNDVEIVIVGDFPGMSEIESGFTFIGQAGRMLDRLLKKANIDRDKCYTTYAIKCGGSKAANITDYQMLRCRKYLMEELKSIRPKVVITMGSIATQMLNGWSSENIATAPNDVQQLANELQGESIVDEVYATKILKKIRGAQAKRYFPNLEYMWNMVRKDSELGCYIISTFSPLSAVPGSNKSDKTKDFSSVMAALSILRTFEIAQDYTELERRANPRPVTYKIARTVEQVKKVVDFLLKKDIIAADIETGGLAFWRDDILCASFSWGEGTGVTIPLKGQITPDMPQYKAACKGEYAKCPDIWNPFEYKTIMGLLKQLLESSVKKIFQNGKFDLKFLRAHNIFVKNFVFDTMLAHHLLNENLLHDLGYLTAWYTDMGRYDMPLELAKPNKDCNYSVLPAELLYYYAAADPDATFRTYVALKAELAKDRELELLFYEHVMESSHAFTDIEYEGVLVNRDMVLSTADTLSQQIEQLEQEIITEYTPLYQHLSGSKELFNPASSDQLGLLLFKGFGLKPLKQTSGGKNSVDKEVLSKLDHPLTNRILEARKLTKFRDTYVYGESKDGKKTGLLPKLDANNRIHTEYWIHGTVTGRLCVAGDTLLNTDKGCFEIKNLHLGKWWQKGQNVHILTHRGRMQKILHRYYKGKEYMYEVITGQGYRIKCTAGHRFLTPHGWRSLKDIAIGDKVYTNNNPSTRTSSRPVSNFGRKQFQAYYNRTKAHRKTSYRFIQKPWFESSCVDHINEVLQRKIWNRNQKNQELQVFYGTQGQHTRSEGCPCHDYPQRSVTKKVGYGEINSDNSTRVGNFRMVCAPESKISSTQTKPFAAPQDDRCRYPISGEVGAICTGDFGSYIQLLRQSGTVFQSVISKFQQDHGTVVVYSRLPSDARLFLVHKQNSEKSCLLEYEQGGVNTFDGITGTEDTPCQTVYVDSTYDGRLCFSQFDTVSGGRRWLSRNRCGDTKTRPTKRRRDTKTRLHTFAGNQRRSFYQTSRGYFSYQTDVIRVIHGIGVQDVWDIEVENDHSYIAHGFINHNSSKNPNLQNIPKDNTIKNFFIAEPGYKLVEIDYRAAEVRALAAISRDPKLIERCRPGIDIHSETAADVFGIPLEKILEMKKAGKCPQRDAAKSVLFGIIYGEGAAALGAKLGMSKDEAQNIIDGIFKAYPLMAKLIKKYHRTALKGLPIITPFGRKRRLFADLYDQEEYGAKIGEILRQSVNSPIQGTASEITIKSLVSLWKRFKQEEVDAKIRLTVHDSIVVEFRDEPDTHEKVDYIVDDAMIYHYPGTEIDFLIDKHECYMWEKG